MGTDKLAEPLGASTVLGELLARVPLGVPVVVVGPLRDLPARSPAVLTLREDPPGGGPAAAVAAGLSAVVAEGTIGGPSHAPQPGTPRAVAAVDVVVVCAGDAPWSPLVVPSLVAALRAAPGAEVAVAVDGSGTRQPLLAAHRVAALRTRLAALDPAGARAGALLGPGPVEVRAPEALLADVDTPAHLAAARSRG